MPALLFNISNESMKTTEQIWDGILSQDSTLILATYNDENEANQKVILSHLQKMVNDEGWHLEQKMSAQIALDCINMDVKD